MGDGTPVQCLIVEVLIIERQAPIRQASAYYIKYKLELLMHKLLAVIYLRYRPYH